MNFNDYVTELYKRWGAQNLTFKEFLHSLSIDEEVAVLIGVLDSQVCNGGFRQWVDNGYAIYVTEVVNALYTVGTPTAKKVVNMLLKIQPFLDMDLEYEGPFGEYWIYDGDDEEDNIGAEIADNLDDDYYKINDQLIKDTEEYLNSKIDTHV